MKPVFKPAMLACLMAATGLAAIAQTPAPAPVSPMQQGGTPAKAGTRDGADQRNPAQFQERMKARITRRQTELKTHLKLTPEQEGAWSAFNTAMRPPTHFQRPDRTAMAQLTTPERLDKVRELRQQRDAAMDQRIDATKTFYAALSAEQQKTFDAGTARGFHGHDRWGGRAEHRGH